MNETCANTHEGKVVSFTGNKLVMAGQDGKEHSHTVAEDVKLTCHGKVCKAEDLKPGTFIRVTTKKEDKSVATQIEGFNKNETHANKHEGKVVSITGNKLVMTGHDGKEHSHTVAADIKVTGDGKVSKLGDLKPGTKIRVTTKNDDKSVATGIELVLAI